MKKLTLSAVMLLSIAVFAVFAQAPLPQGAPGPNLPKGKAPEQGYVPEGWPAHPGSLMKYSVEIRFGEEPETMPEGMKFGRVSGVTTDNEGNVYVFKRDPKTDQLVVFNSQGKFLRSWGKGMFTRPHGLRVDASRVALREIQRLPPEGRQEEAHVQGSQPGLEMARARGQVERGRDRGRSAHLGRHAFVPLPQPLEEHVPAQRDAHEAQVEIRLAIDQARHDPL